MPRSATRKSDQRLRCLVQNPRIMENVSIHIPAPPPPHPSPPPPPPLPLIRCFTVSICPESTFSHCVSQIKKEINNSQQNPGLMLITGCTHFYQPSHLLDWTTIVTVKHCEVTRKGGSYCDFFFFFFFFDESRKMKNAHLIRAYRKLGPFEVFGGYTLLLCWLTCFVEIKSKKKSMQKLSETYIENRV